VEIPPGGGPATYGLDQSPVELEAGDLEKGVDEEDRKASQPQLVQARPERETVGEDIQSPAEDGDAQAGLQDVVYNDLKEDVVVVHEQQELVEEQQELVSNPSVQIEWRGQVFADPLELESTLKRFVEKNHSVEPPLEDLNKVEVFHRLRRASGADGGEQEEQGRDAGAADDILDSSTAPASR
ncbi:unnamed protein product, partial [Amoebophrya sp. A25]